jgi:cytochrome b
MTKLNSERRSLLKVASAIAVSGVATSFVVRKKAIILARLGNHL